MIQEDVKLGALNCGYCHGPKANKYLWTVTGD